MYTGPQWLQGIGIVYGVVGHVVQHICNWPLASTRSGRGLLGSDSGELPELGDVTVDSSILSTRTLACLFHWLAYDRSGRYI